MVYSVLGVRCKKIKSFSSAWHSIRKTTPKVHILIYIRDNTTWVKACRPNDDKSGFEPSGEIVDDSTEVTCKLCIRTNFDREI